MTCCTVNNCISRLHCGSACESKGHFHLQMSWDIGHKTFDLPSFVLSSSLWLSFSMTKEITVNINCNSWSITFPKNSDNEIFTQPHLPKLKMKLVVHPDYRCYWLFDFCLVNSYSNVLTIGRPKVGPYLFDHNVVVFKCGICQRQNEIRPKVKAARDKRLSRITAAIRAQSPQIKKPQIKINLWLWGLLCRHRHLER